VRKCDRAVVEHSSSPRTGGSVRCLSCPEDPEDAVVRFAGLRRTAPRACAGFAGRALVGLEGARDRGLAPRA
jgi:hypothetical protein